MAKKEKLEKSKNWQIFKYTKDETKQAVFAVLFFISGIFLILSAFGKSGIVGRKVYESLDLLLGVGYFLLPLFFFILTFSYLKTLKQNFHISKIIFSFFALLSSLGIIDLLLPEKAGIVGHAIGSPLNSLVDFYASVIILTGALIVFVLLLLDAKLDMELLLFWKNLFSSKKKDAQLKTEVLVESEKKKIDDASLIKEEKNKPEVEKEEEKPQKLKIATPEEDDFVVNKKNVVGRTMKYTPLPLSLLERDSGKPGVGDIKANANIIKRTLQNFGINVEMDEIAIGPSITRYSLKPAEGVKLSRIVGLQNDLALALAAHPIRIEAPIPGKSLVGIEIPNVVKTTVGLGTLLSSAEFQESDKPLLISLGKAISGKSHFANLAKMPHLLIAGATGSGKSVTIHSIITSLLYRNSPENLKMIMIDPKRVELTMYNKIPHLLTPVITEAKKAILSLKWAAKEMDRRYDILESESVRDIESYHKNILEPELKKLGNQKEGEEVKIPEMMPYILIVIDELADIMQTYPRELEGAIVRLAQMSRAVGIHLMLSTQRPSVNIITGLIKANIPARIALQVSSQIDSRTILDTGGAEKLLGAGDMLYLGGEMSKPQRLQSSFIGEAEVKKVVNFLKHSYSGEVPGEINLTEVTKNSLFEASLEEESLEDEDELYEDARLAILEAGKASTSYLQRKLGLGYARAARLMDTLEKRGIVGPGEGSKPREVIGATSSEDKTTNNEE